MFGVSVTSWLIHAAASSKHKQRTTGWIRTNARIRPERNTHTHTHRQHSYTLLRERAHIRTPRAHESNNRYTQAWYAKQNVGYNHARTNLHLQRTRNTRAHTQPQHTDEGAHLIAGGAHRRPCPLGFPAAPAVVVTTDRYSPVTSSPITLTLLDSNGDVGVTSRWVRDVGTDRDVPPRGAHIQDSPVQPHPSNRLVRCCTTSRFTPYTATLTKPCTK